MLRRIRLAALITCLLVRPAAAAAASIDFEAFTADDVLTTQVPGVVFTNAIVATAGVSLNEFEFPPASGANVAFDDAGPMRIDFTAPIDVFSGRFTYFVPLTLAAFDALNTPLGAVTSAFAANLALSGDPGSVPNELLALALPNIAYVTITGDPFGASFTVDDISVSAGPVPEPATALLLVLGAAAVARRRVRRNA
jgi:hypothetical protein